MTTSNRSNFTEYSKRAGKHCSSENAMPFASRLLNQYTHKPIVRIVQQRGFTHSAAAVSNSRSPETNTKSSKTEPTSKPKAQSIGKTALPPRPSLPESSITEVFLCGSGPGGQKINKTASAVQLTHLPTGIVLKCQATRSRIQNRKIARQLLAEKIDVLEKGDESRLKVKEERKVGKKKSGEKKRRRKYRALEEAGKGTDDEGEESDSIGDNGRENHERLGGSGKEAAVVTTT